MIKAVEIRETLLDFLEEHPEIHASTDKKGNIQIFPTVEGIENWSFTNVLGNIRISYTYHGEYVNFPTD